MSEYFVFEVWQDGDKVASVTAPDRYKAMAEAAHYAMMYGQDGPVEVMERIGRKRVPVAVNAEESNSG